MSMKFVIAFMIIATIFAIATLLYVVVEIIIDIFRRDEKEEKKEEPVPVVVPVPVEEKPPVVVPIVLPEIVDHIDAEEADELIDDSVALAVAQHEYGAGTGARSYINLGVIDKHFEADETVTLPVLKAKKLIPAKIRRIKILADGVLTKPLTVKAESYSIQAMKMIELTGGTVVILEPDPNEVVPTKGKKKKR